MQKTVEEVAIANILSDVGLKLLDRIEKARSWLRNNEVYMTGEVITRCNKRINNFELAIDCD